MNAGSWTSKRIDIGFGRLHLAVRGEVSATQIDHEGAERFHIIGVESCRIDSMKAAVRGDAVQGRRFAHGPSNLSPCLPDANWIRIESVGHLPTLDLG